MSATDQMRAMLDAMMGTARNGLLIASVVNPSQSLHTRGNWFEVY